MSLYYISKNRFFSGLPNCRPTIQNHWNGGAAGQSLGAGKSYKSTSTSNQSTTNITPGATPAQASGNRGNSGHSSSSYVTPSSTTTSPTSSHISSASSSSRKGKPTHRFKTIRRSWSWKAGAGWTILSVLDWWLLAAGGWLSWRGVFLKWTPLGICVVAAVQWQWNRRHGDVLRRNEVGGPRTASNWQTSLYCSLPLRMISRGWGWIADCRVPIPIRPLVYGCYSAAFGVNLDEAASNDFKSYRSLAEFFARSLKENARLIDATSCLVSPADGKVLYFGRASSEQIEQVKGVSYSLKSFLGPANWVRELRPHYADSIRMNQKQDTELFQCVIYLAPGDYHRFHSPANWQPELRRHFSGELLSVSPVVAAWIPGLFCLNERALYIGKWKHGFFSFTAVGATNVGSVQIYMDEQLKTNKWTGLKVGKTNSVAEFDELLLPTDKSLAKGEIIGQFNMGSTVVLIFEAPTHFRFFVEPGQKIKMGEPLGCVKPLKKLADP